MKRVLIISYYWPPSGGSGVQRWVKFARYLPAQGWQPVVYTPENPELIARDTTLAEELPPEVEVLRRPIFEPYGLYRKFCGKKKKENAKDEVNPINAQKKSFGQKISMFIRGNFFIPDPRCLWVGPSVRWLKKYLKEHPVDVIVSTGPPHSMHLIARKLSRATGLPWIADFRDPWTGMFYFKHLNLCGWAERRHRKLEQQVLDDASIVVAVSPLVQQDFRSMTSTPVALITNGYDEEDFAEAGQKASTCGPEGKFTVTHTGLFAADGNPLRLWEALADKCAGDRDFAEALEIRLVGKTDRDITAAIEAAGLGDRFIDLGYCNHHEAVREQIMASVLILPLRQEPEYKATLPGKLFEYLASRRPVLGIGQKDGAMATILQETGAGETWDWEEKEQLRHWIDGRWEEFKAGKLTAGTHDIGKYSRKATAAQMSALLEQISQSKHTH